MYNKTITVFVHNGDYWLPRIIKGTEIVTSRGYLGRSYGYDLNASAEIHINYNFVDGKRMISGKELVEPIAFESASTAEKASLLTLRGGKDFDFVWYGDYLQIDSTLASISDLTFPEGFFEHWRNTHDNTWTIVNVSGPYTLLPHVELVCR